MVKNFVIPLEKNHLLTSYADQYFVEEITPLRMISQFFDVTRSDLQAKGAHFILDHFDIFFSVVVHGSKVELAVCLRFFNRIHKAVEILVDNLENIFDRGQNIAEEDRKVFLCISNMLAYLFSWFICHIDEQVMKSANQSNIGKYKKNAKSDVEKEWEQTRQKVLTLLYRWLQMPLYKIWNPPVVESSFVTTLGQICYKILEQSNNEAKQKHMRQTIFEILGTLIKKYNHGIACVERIIQLVKFYDTLAVPIAAGVVYMTIDCDCKGLIKEVMIEIGRSDVNETDSRNISKFLENIATMQPDLIIPILDEIVDYLSNNFYVMRCCVIGVLGAVVQKALTGENLTEEQIKQRDECLNNLEEHILDCNAYVRSKVLQTWQHLCCEGAVPLARQGRLLTAVTLQLEDKSASVRKQALQLLRTLLQSNPFAGKLNCAELAASLEKEQAKLQELMAQVANTSKRGHVQRFELWTILLPYIDDTIKKTILENDQAQHINDNADEPQDEENIEPDYAFEHVRQLLLSQKVTEAVTYLWKICTKLKEGSKMENLSIKAKKERLLAILLKIFIDSEGKSVKNEPNEEDANDTEKLEEDKRNEEISKRKRVTDYLKNCLMFATELEKAIPVAEKLLFSTCASDAVESCAFLGTAFQFGVTGAFSCVRNALFQVFHRDQSVRNNVAAVYKEIYLNIENNTRSSRQIAVARANRLIDLLKELQPGQSPALAQLIASWYEHDELNNELLQVLWEKYSMKYPATSPVDSRAALMIITMIAQTEGNVATSNLDVLVKVGLGPRANDDLLLARDTCRILWKMKHDNKDMEKSPLRYSNDHEMFRKILALLIDNFISAEENIYISFTTDVINVIYHLANQPDELIKTLLLEITEKGEFISKETDQMPSVSYSVLAKLLYIIGHVAIKHMVYLDMSVYKELKRRNEVREMHGKKNQRAAKKLVSATRNNRAKHSTSLNACQNSSRNKDVSLTSIQEDNGEEALEGAMDDAEAEFVNSVLENEIVTGNGLLAKFVPLVLDVCKYPDKYNNESVQAAGSLALSKMMTVSSEFCEQSLQLLVTILERTSYPGVKSNMLIGLSDLATRFPNQVEPWSKHIYGKLRDADVNVRRTCVRMLSNLIMREMIRVKGQVSELALCIIDEDAQIRQDTKEFFNQLAQKGNALYNIMPDVLSRLADPELNLDEKQFQETIKYILCLVQKEKQVDTIIEKICARFKLAVTERQWRDLSYCLSLLQFNAKSIRSLIESLPLLKDKIYHKPVLTALQSIIEQAKKKADTKAACTELEEKIQELLQTEEKSETVEKRLMPPPSTVHKKNVRQSKRKITNDDDSSDDSEEEEEVVKLRNRKARLADNEKISRTRSAIKRNDDKNDDANECALLTPTRNDKRSRTQKRETSATSSSGSNKSPSPKRDKISKPLRNTKLLTKSGT